jgi:hypothetical protein
MARFGQVLHDRFPDEECSIGRREATRFEQSAELLAVEVDRRESDVLRHVSEKLSKSSLLCLNVFSQIDLPPRQVGERWKPICPSVEASTKIDQRVYLGDALNELFVLCTASDRSCCTRRPGKLFSLIRSFQFRA